MKDLEVGDTVEHRGSGRRGVVLEVGKTWFGLAVAFVELREPSGRLAGYEIPRAVLRKMEETREERMARAFPHGPDEPCTCDGCHDGRYGCTGHVVGCTCDIEWDWDS